MMQTGDIVRVDDKIGRLDFIDGDNRTVVFEDGGQETFESTRVEKVMFPGIAKDDLRNSMKGQRFEVEDLGFVQVVDWMGSDSAIVQAARVSYGAGTKKVSEDEGLIRYLMRQHHTTPFEMCELKLLVRVPMDAWRQWIRHRTASVNEYSTRYSEAIDDRATAGTWRVQAVTNKQGSGVGTLDWPAGACVSVGKGDFYNWLTKQEDGNWCRDDGSLCPEPDDIQSASINGDIFIASTPEEWLTAAESAHHVSADTLYRTRLMLNVAREQARKDLPLSTYTEAYWKIDLHNLFHFLRLRMDSHAQLEIRRYADVIGKQIVAKLWPMAWRAFLDYRFNTVTLSAIDIDVIRGVIALSDLSKRERDDHSAKLEKIYGTGRNS